MRPIAIVILCAVAVCAAACGPSSPGGDADGGTSVPDTGLRCAEGETRCFGGQHQACVDGAFQDRERCERLCADDLGCIDCDPSLGNTCRDNDIVQCSADGSYGAPVQTCPAGTECAGGTCGRACSADGVDLIYVVDKTSKLRSFDPRKVGTGVDPFTLIGTLDCPAGPPVSPLLPRSPFSMSIDRQGTAWVLYTSGQIFHASIDTARCQATAYRARQGGMDLFGMGFVSDTAGSEAEHLYLGGGNANVEAPGRRFAVVDPASLALRAIGPLEVTTDYTPDFTGTGAGELFGFFPDADRAFVREIDLVSGTQTGPEWRIPGGTAGVSAWAFAHWGGTFYLFVTGAFGNSTVRSIDRTGAHAVLLERLPFQIVGAGVSTCAPTDIDP